LILLNVFERRHKARLSSPKRSSPWKHGGWQNLPLLIHVAQMDQQALTIPAFGPGQQENCDPIHIRRASK